MKLALVRHGEAGVHKNDDLRELTTTGIAQAKKLATRVDNLKFRPKVIFHSDLVRAKQTASYIHQKLTSAQLEENTNLRHSSPIHIWENELYAFNQEEDIMLVGHNPFMGLLQMSLTQKEISFQTSSCLILERHQDSWSLMTQLHPQA